MTTSLLVIIACFALVLAAIALAWWRIFLAAMRHPNDVNEHNSRIYPG